jgi:hypothetical protein
LKLVELGVHFPTFVFEFLEVFDVCVDNILDDVLFIVLTSIFGAVENAVFEQDQLLGSGQLFAVGDVHWMFRVGMDGFFFRGMVLQADGDDVFHGDDFTFEAHLEDLPDVVVLSERREVDHLVFVLSVL